MEASREADAKITPGMRQVTLGTFFHETGHQWELPNRGPGKAIMGSSFRTDPDVRFALEDLARIRSRLRGPGK